MDDLQIWICEENIKRFSAQLAGSLNVQRRQIVSQLLKEEMAVLWRLRCICDASGHAVQDVRQGETDELLLVVQISDPEFFGVTHHLSDSRQS